MAGGLLSILTTHPWLVPFAIISIATDIFVKPDRTLRGSDKPIDFSPGQWLTACPLPSWRYEFGGAVLGGEVYLILDFDSQSRARQRPRAQRQNGWQHVTY